MSITKICHFTSAHSAEDQRIFVKECCSLASCGYDTVLVAADTSDNFKDGVKIMAVSKLKGRIRRIIFTAWMVYKKARSVDADIYHFHDAELLPYGFLLKNKGKKVIYDVHEDMPAAIMTKYWIPGFLRSLVAASFRLFENWIARHMSYIVAATPFIAERFQRLGCRVANINNYPVSVEFSDISINNPLKERAVCYIGAISKERGIFEVINAVSNSDITLLLAGEFSPVRLRKEAIKMSGWSNVKEFGRTPRKQVKQILSESVAGLVTFHPVPNHINAKPNKMFEYMSAGLPLIASNFPLWREIIEGDNCGICVDPLDSGEIARVIRWFVEHPQEARLMGENGRKAVIKKYNWEFEFEKLLKVYKELE